MGNERITEDEVIERCLAGERDAYAVLVERYKDMAYTIAYRMLGEEDRARDAAQEAFIAAYRGLGSFRRTAKFSTWLASIVLNACRDELRKRSRTVPLEGMQNELRTRGDDPEDLLRKKESSDRLQEALGRLPADYREVLVLKHIQGLDYHEIARVTGVREGALKVRAHRAREMLKQILTEGG